MKIHFIVLSMIVFGSVHGQGLKLESAGLNTSGFFVDETFRLVTTPQVGFGKNKFTISTGPVIMVATEIAASNKNFPKLVGVQGTYTYYPNGKNNKLSLFLYDELKFMRIKDVWNSTIYDGNISQYVDYKYQNIEYLTQNLVGYGMRYAPSKRFHVSTKAGLGFYYSAIDGDELSTGAPEIEDNTTGQGYSSFGLSFGLNVSFHYKF